MYEDVNYFWRILGQVLDISSSLKFTYLKSIKLLLLILEKTNMIINVLGNLYS